MGKSTPAPPTPPDPYKVAGAQTGANVGSAIASGVIGNVNQSGPQGSTTYNQTDTYKMTGPDGQTYDVPRYTQTTSLSPTEQGLYDQQGRLKAAFNDLALSQTQRLGGVLGSPVDASGLPAMSGAPNTNTTDFSASARGMTPTDFSAAVRNMTPTDFSTAARSMTPTDYSKSLTSDFSSDRAAVEKALFDRLNPQLDRDRAALENNLTNQGFQRGTDAFNSAMDQFGRQSNDARLDITARGLGEQQGLYGMARDRAGFGASEEQRAFDQAMAAGQFGASEGARGYNQALSSGQFGSSEAARAFDQAMTSGQFGASEEARRFNTGLSGATFGNQARGQSLSEMLALRNQPINEISALTSGGQVSLPQAAGYNAPQINAAPIGDYMYNTAGLQNQQWQTQEQAAAQKQAALFGAIGGLGGAGLYGLGSGKLGGLFGTKTA